MTRFCLKAGIWTFDCRALAWTRVLVLGLATVLGGCRGESPASDKAPVANKNDRSGEAEALTAQQSDSRAPAAVNHLSQPGAEQASNAGPHPSQLGDDQAPPSTGSRKKRPDPSRPDSNRSLSDLLLELEQDDSPAESGDGSPELGPGRTVDVEPRDEVAPAELVPMPLDDDKLRNFGIRKLTGRHFKLYTDVESSTEVDELPQVFDEAIAGWVEYFELAPDRLDDWRVTGFLIGDQAKFVALGLLPQALPPFLNGYQAGRQIWFYEQPTAYYRRHLMLHEGTHAVMQRLYGSGGPPWYMEGLAELLGTHRWNRDEQPGARLQLNYFPRDKAETPHWGRIKIVQEDFAANRGMSLPAILLYPPSAHLKNEPYGWCWAAAAFLDHHPDYRDTFRDLRNRVRRSDFNQAFFERNQQHWWQIELQWQLFVSRIDYGYDVAAEAVAFKPGERLETGDSRVVELQVARGWQSTGIQVEADRPYRLESRGRYQIATEDAGEVWWCEPSGVTLQYYAGFPLGTVLAAVHPDNEPPRQLTLLARPAAVGLDQTLQFPVTGTLYLRANDSPATMNDNAGTFHTRVTGGSGPGP